MKAPFRHLLSVLLLAVAPAHAVDEVSGRIFPDNYQPEPTENVPWQYDQRATYIPRMYADTYDTRFHGVYIHSYEADPPTAVAVYIYDGSSDLVAEKTADLKVMVGRWDGANNFILHRTRIIKDIALTLRGITRVPVNIHNYKAEIILTKLLDVRTKTNILLKDNY